MRYFIFLIAGLLILSSGCPKIDNKEYTDEGLASQAKSGLEQEIYSVIADSDNGTVAQRNAMMDAVRSAIEKIDNQQDRDKAISDAVDANGMKFGLAQKIIDAVNKERPLAPKIKTQEQSGLKQAIYDVIAVGDNGTVKQINAIIDAVLSAITTKNNQQDRDKAIRDAVDLNGMRFGLAQKIIDAVNIGHPFEKLKTQAESGLKPAIYNVIANFSTLSDQQKNALVNDVVEVLAKKHKRKSIRANAIEDAVKKYMSIYQFASPKLINVINAEEPIEVMSEAESGLKPQVYKVIKDYWSSDVELKNTIMEEVLAVVNKPDTDITAREKDIKNAVEVTLLKYYTSSSILVKNIIAAVNAAYPIVKIKSETQSGLDARVWKVINDYLHASNSDKNDIMEDVKNAIDSITDDQSARDNAIRQAVTKRGNFPQLAEDIITQVNIARPISKIMSEKASGLPGSLYQTIKNFSGPADEQKNEIMKGVKKAIDAALVHNDRKKLNAEIDAVIKTQGNYTGFFNSVRDQVDATVTLTPLKTRAQSLLRQSVYDIIRNESNGTVTQRNAIMDVVRLAIITKGDQKSRDEAIIQAVESYGKKAGLAQKIIDAVNIDSPIVGGVNLKTEKDSGLTNKVYNIIKAYAATASIKNKIIDDVRAAIEQQPKIQSLRNTDIAKAISDAKINDTELVKNITKAVDEADPIGTLIQRQFLKKLEEYNDLPRIKITVTDATGIPKPEEVPEPKKLKAWKDAIEKLINDHVKAYGIDYRSWLKDFYVLHKSLELKDAKIAEEFITKGTRFFKDALAAGEKITLPQAQPFFTALKDEIDKYPSKAEMDYTKKRAQWIKNVYPKLEDVIKNFKPELLNSDKILSLIDEKVTYNLLKDNLRERIEAANEPFKLVNKYKDALEGLLKKFKLGEDWKKEADPLLKKLRDLGISADDLENKFKAKATAGPNDKLDEVKTAFADFEADFAKFYDGNNLVDPKHEVKWSVAAKALETQAEIIKAYKNSQGMAWENNQKNILEARKEDVAEAFLRYSAERIDEMIDKLEKFRKSAPSAGAVYNDLGGIYSILPIANKSSAGYQMLSDLLPIIQGTANPDLNDLKARIGKQQKAINALLKVGNIPDAVAGKNKKIVDKFIYDKDQFANIAKEYGI